MCWRSSLLFCGSQQGLNIEEIRNQQNEKQQGQSYFYSSGPGHSFVNFQPQVDQRQAAQQFSANFFPSAAAFRGTPAPTYQQPELQPSPYQLPPQYDPYLRGQFHTNQHLPQPFHPQTPRYQQQQQYQLGQSLELNNFDYDDKLLRPTSSYYTGDHPQGLVDQLDSGNRWRGHEKKAKKPDEHSSESSSTQATRYQDIDRKKTSRGTPPPKVPTSTEEPTTRGRTKFNKATPRSETRIKPTTYVPPSTFAPRQRGRFRQEDSKPVTTTSTTTTTTTTTPSPDVFFDTATDTDYELEYILSEEPGDTVETFDETPAALVKPDFNLRNISIHHPHILLPGPESMEEEKTTVTTTTAPTTVRPVTITPSTVRPITFRNTANAITSQKPTTTTETVTTTLKSVTSNQVTAPKEDPDAAQPTESWVIVASVQTSRSVSGARFLPGIVKQEETQKPLSPNGTIQEKNNNQEPNSLSSKETQEITNSPPSEAPIAKVNASTESIIDKLDRVQSELSSGILNGFRHGGNKLELGVLPDMGHENKSTTTTTILPTTSTVTTTTTSTSTTTRASTTTEEQTERNFVRKFVPAAKRTTIKPKKSIIENIQYDELSGLLPPGFKVRTTKPPEGSQKDQNIHSRENSGRSTGNTIKNKVQFEDVSSFLPPGFKKDEAATTEKPKGIETLLTKITFDDVSSLLPPGYSPDKTKEKEQSKTKSEDEKKPSSTEKPKVRPTLPKIKFEAPPSLLPPGFKPTDEESNDSKTILDSLLKKVEFKDVSAVLPPNFKVNKTETGTEEPTTTEVPTTASPSGKVVFPSRPGGNRKPGASRTKSAGGLSPVAPKIQKGWPTRATTEFTGWPTPSTTPMSVEKILAAAKAAAAAAATSTSTTTETATTTTTTSTTTTPRPTTPGLCSEDCDMAATIRLTGGVKWVPELLDHNTLEWQHLANDIANQLEAVYSSSDSLSKWYRKIRIDAFSEGSVLVDYFVELSELGRTVNTAEMKRLFHESLSRYSATQAALGAAPSPQARGNSTEYQLGKFVIDPNYTDFIVLPKVVVPTVGYAMDDELLPQWAIAVIVIGLASLLFVIIFGVTVLVNRHKSSKAKQPTALTEDMLHELNKNHMGGLDNFGADDLYNMEDVWNDKPPKKRSSGSLQENSMANLYDSWRSEWNGYYYNAYYGAGPGTGTGTGTGSGYSGRRRSDYDTNF